MRISWGVPSGPDDLQPGEGSLLDRVGGEDGLGNFEEVVGLGANGCGQRGHDVDELLSRQGHADDAGGRRKYLLRPAGEDARGGFAGGVGGIEAGLSGGAVGVAGVDGHDAHFSGGGGEVLLVYDERRGDDAVGREGRGGAGRRVGDDEREVGASAGFERRP